MVMPASGNLQTYFALEGAAQAEGGRKRCSAPIRLGTRKAAARKVEVTMAYTIKINAVDHSVDVDGNTPCSGCCGRARHDRNQVRLRQGSLRRVYRPHR
jgi:hypothetical protein